MKLTNIVKEYPKSEQEVVEIIKSHISELLPEFEVVSIKAPFLYENYAIDLLIDMRVGRTRKKIVCEVKLVGEPRYIAQAITQLERYTIIVKNSYPLFIAPYISDAGRKLCKDRGVGFLDLTGNCHIRFDNILIEKVGENRIKRERKILKRLFSPVSTRVIRTMLEDPTKKWALKNLSALSNASIGHTYNVVALLKNKGYVMKNREHKLEIKNPGDLLDAWADSYDFSKNKIYNYYTFEKNTDAFIQKVSKIAKNNKLKYALTLHSGASLIAPFVRFTDIHLYFLGDLSTWIKKLELKPIEFGGTVHLVEPFDEGVFYGVQTINDIKVASNIQLYLDLCNYPARGREQAEFLRKEKINF